MRKSKAIINSEKASRENRIAALNLLHRSGAMSRAEITKALGCDGTTITNIIRDLTAEDLVRSKGIIHGSGRGRPKELIELNPEGRTAIGISFNPDSVSAVLTDLNGDCKIREDAFFEPGISRGAFLDVIVKICRRILDRTEPGKLAGLGAATFGVLSLSEHTVIRAEYFPALEGLDLDKFFSEEFGLSPRIIDGTYALALNEMWRLKDKAPGSFVLLELGMGIGVAIINNGQPYLGRDGFANEFGHMVFNPDGEPCQFGHRGCLESLAAIPALQRKITAATGAPEPAFHKIVENYLAGESPYREIVDESAKWLGTGIANLVNFSVPEQLIMGGSLLEFGPDYLEIVKKHIMTNAFPVFTKQLAIKTSSSGSDGASTGAAILVLRQFLGY